MDGTTQNDEWVKFCRRTNDPKLAVIEHLLKGRNIPSRRNGESFHAPILEVPKAHEEAAWDMLGEKYDMDDKGLMPLDDIEDDDPLILSMYEECVGEPYAA